MTKKIIILAGMLALAANAFATNYTLTTGSGNWNDISTLSGLTDTDRVTFSSLCNVSISTAITKNAWITVGYQNNGGTLSILGGGGYVAAAASNMTFGLGVNGAGMLKLAANSNFRTQGAIYFGQNGGTGTASIAGILSTSNTIYLGRSDGTFSSSGAITMTSGILNAGVLSVAAGTSAVTGNSQMTGYVDLQGGRLNVGAVTMGTSSAKLSNANMTISSALLSANVNGAFTMNAASHLTLSAAASTDWISKGAILAISGTFNISNTSTIVLNLNDFDGWDGMKAGEKITMTLATYGTLVTSGTPSISAVGLSEDFTLGTFNVGENAATVEITYNPIPEPAMAAGLMGGAVLLLAVRRRRKL